MPFGNVSLAVEDHGTTALKPEVTKLHERPGPGEIVSLYRTRHGADYTTKGRGTAAWGDGFRLYALDAEVKISMTNGYMVERQNIQHGTWLKLITQRDGVASGTLAHMDTVR
jgi:hypothetical protein